jgi:NAD+ kinase
VHSIHPQSVLLVTKRGHAHALGMAARIHAWLRDQGLESRVTENLNDLSECLPLHAPILVLVLGGDGTMISVAGKLCTDKVAILGINFARVGFLTECPRDDWQSVLRSILDQGAPVSSRMLLDVRVVRSKETILSTVAVNDIVVGRGRLARLINLQLFFDQERIAQLRADGLILSTPTGSSAYSYSAGGPLVFPELDVICTTPICSFLTEIKPFVLPADKPIRVRLDEDTMEAFLTLDGQSGHPLCKGDEVIVARSARRMNLVTFSGSSYFQKLKAKGFLQES